MKIFITQGVFILFLIFFQGCKSTGNDFKDLSKKYKAYSESAKIKPVFIPMSPGAVTPTGWIKDWSEAAAKGITGHLDEYSSVFSEAWKGHSFSAVGVTSEGTGWPLEQCSYWLDGAVRLAYILNDTALINKISKRLNYVVDGVLNGGQSFIYWKPRSILTDTTGGTDPSFNSWAHSHMGRALVAYYQATHDERILNALIKAYKSYPLPDLRSGFSLTGAVNLDPMIETYLMSGDKTILDSILSFSKRASYKYVSDSWNKEEFNAGHDVIYYENIRVPAMLYPWTGNKTDLDASIKAIEWGEKNHLLPVGVCSGEEALAGIGATRNVETCNVSASIWTFLWMLRITGERSYSDRIEKIFFNAASAPVSRDFSTLCYFQSLNRYNDTLPGELPYTEGRNSYKFTKLGLGALCCPGNLGRVIPNYIINMWMFTMDKGLAATLYGPCKVHARVANNVSVDIDCKTSYPFEESINMSVNPEKDIEFPLYLRIPEWCQNPEIKINETEIYLKQEGDEFIKLSRVWKKNDKITLYFPMNIKVLKGRETPYPQIRYPWKKVKMVKDTTINNLFECVYYGPLLFSLAIMDETPNKVTPNAKFNYALDVNPNSIENQITVTRTPMPGKWDWSLDAPVQLRVKAKEFAWKPTEEQPLPKELVRSNKSTFINLVPYGCTKFRITMFPVTEKSWNSSPNVTMKANLGD